MIQLNDLVGYQNRKIYQNTEYFNFTLDSVLLAEFASLNLSVKRVLEIGSGTGAISLILSSKTNALIDAAEIQKPLCDLFKKSITYNCLENQINLYCEDIKKSSLLEKNNYYDLIVCNPPYFNESKKNDSPFRSIARHEETLNLGDVVRISRKLLKDRGKLAIVYDSKRLMEALTLMEDHRIIPKRLKTVHDHMEKEASSILLEGIKNGRKGLKIEAPFIGRSLDFTTYY